MNNLSALHLIAAHDFAKGLEHGEYTHKSLNEIRYKAKEIVSEFGHVLNEGGLM